MTAIYVGAIVRRGGEILLVRQAAGHPLEGQWSVPWGRVEPGEAPLDAVVREIREEGGVVARVEGMLGIQELPAPQHGSVGLVYWCAHDSGEPAPRDRETDAARYFSAADLDALAEPMEPWSAWLARRVFAGEHRIMLPNAASPLRPDGAFL